MSPKKRRIPRWVIGFLAALGTVALLMTASRCGGSHNDKPSGPVSPGLTATKDTTNQAMSAVPAIGCNDLASPSSLATQAGHKLSLDWRNHTNSDRADRYVLVCTYTASDGRILAQTEYSILTSLGSDVYYATRNGAANELLVSKIPASQLPQGVDSGYFFSPADLPSDQRSTFLNSGFTLRVAAQTVTVTYRDFSREPSSVKQRFMHNAARSLIIPQ